MFLFSKNAQLCPPGTQFAVGGSPELLLAPPPDQQPFLALWGQTEGVCTQYYRVMCCGSPVFTNITQDMLTRTPCFLLAQSIADDLQNHGPDQAIAQHVQSVMGAFTVLVWDTQKHTYWIYTHHLPCFTNATKEPSFTSHPYVLPPQELFTLADQTLHTAPLSDNLIKHPHQYQLLDPLHHFKAIALPPGKALPVLPKKVTFFAEDMGLPVARMIKDHFEHHNHIHVDIFPLTPSINLHAASDTHPHIILPTPFSPHQNTIQKHHNTPNVFTVTPQDHICQDVFTTPLLYPLKQWVTVRSMLGQSSPASIDYSHVFSLIEQCTESISLLRQSYRLYLGRHTLAAFARVCAYYDQSITGSHAMHYPAGELKHGPLALVDEKITAIMFAPYDDNFQKNINNAQEILSRKGHVIIFTDTKGQKYIQPYSMPHIAVSTSDPVHFIMLSWMCMHRLMFLMDIE